MDQLERLQAENQELRAQAERMQVVLHKARGLIEGHARAHGYTFAINEWIDLYLGVKVKTLHQHGYITGKGYKK